MNMWTWNDGMESRSRMPASGNVYRFKGSDIGNVVKVVKSQYEKNGKWSNTTYHCISPQGTMNYSWVQSWEEGLYWPQASWEEAVKTVQEFAPQARAEAIEAIIRQHWGKAAARFDENRNALMAFAQMAAPAVEPEAGEPEIAHTDNVLEWVVNNIGMIAGARLEKDDELVLSFADGNQIRLLIAVAERV